MAKLKNPQLIFQLINHFALSQKKLSFDHLEISFTLYQNI